MQKTSYTCTCVLVKTFWDTAEQIKYDAKLKQELDTAESSEKLVWDLSRNTNSLDDLQVLFSLFSLKKPKKNNPT